MARTVGQRLAAARRGALVGRVRELGEAAAFLDAEDPAAVVLHVHGPGGVGKTTLLHGVRELAEERGRSTTWVDAGELVPSPEAFLAACGGAADGGTLAPESVLLVDRGEALGALDEWLWRQFLPGLPEECRVVVGSRRPPRPDRMLDPGWRALLRVLPLRNLPARDAEALLRARGVPDDVDVGPVLVSTHGHPLALAIAADEYVERGDVDGAPGRSGVLGDHPDAAARLLGTFVDEVVDPLQRQALHVCGHARRVDRGLLTGVLRLDDDTADDLLDWLRARPYAESHPDGLSVHDVVRDALDRDLRWRDREAFADLHRRIRDVVVARMARRTGAGHRDAAADLLFLHRGNPDAATLYAFDELGTLVDRPADPDDRDAVLRVVEAADGPERAAVLHGWLERQPAGFHVVLEPGGRVVGVVALVPLDAESAEHDPVAAVALAEIRRRRPPEPGERTVLHQVADGEKPDRLGGFSDVVATVSLREWARPGLGWVVAASTRGTTWTPMWAYIGFEPLAEVPLADGRTVAVWGRDFGRSGFVEWLDALAERELDRDGSAPPPVASPIALDRADFDEAVRAALRDAAAPARLRRSPLAASRLARPRPGEDPAAVDPALRLRDVLRAGVAAVGRQPRGGSPSRALDRTFLRPAATQELAAEVLGLPFGTYRRHLRSGVEALVEVLWDWELHGPPAPEPAGPEVDRS